MVSETRDGWEAAALALLRGEAVVIPTDTVYGLAAIPTLPGAVQRLFALKGRGREVPIAVLVADAAQAWALAMTPVPAAAQDLAGRHWPGALTIVVDRDASWPGDVGDTPSVGLRCPDHAEVRELCARLGPLATTSANLHHEPTPVTAWAAAAAFPSVEVVVDGGTLGGAPSTVVDCRREPPAVLRAGAVRLG